MGKKQSPKKGSDEMPARSMASAGIQGSGGVASGRRLSNSGNGYRKVKPIRDVSAAYFKRLRSDPQERNRFVMSHFPLIRDIANQFEPVFVRKPGCDALVTRDDLESVGVDGAIASIKEFDPSKGFRWTTFGYWYIRGYMIRSLDGVEGAICHLPANARDQLRCLGKRFFNEGDLSEEEEKKFRRLSSKFGKLRNPLRLDQDRDENSDGGSRLRDILVPDVRYPAPHIGVDAEDLRDRTEAVIAARIRKKAPFLNGGEPSSISERAASVVWEQGEPMTVLEICRGFRLKGWRVSRAALRDAMCRVVGRRWILRIKRGSYAINRIKLPVDQLSPRDANILRARLGLVNPDQEIPTLDALKDLHGLTRERIRQIELKGKRAIRARFIEETMK